MSLTATLLDLKGIILGEISQREKNKHCVSSLIHGIKKTKQINKQNKQLIDTENKLMVAGIDGSGDRQNR